jgi:putative transposase
VSVETLCGLFGKKRQWYYANLGRVISERQRRKLLTASVEYYRWLWPRLGGVKLHLILKEELGREVTGGRDSFLRFLSDEGLMLPRLKRRRTTDSNHLYRRYPNLIKGIDIQHVNQVWVSDITYIWIRGDVLYLHLVSDVYSHAIIGWYLSENMEAQNTVKALEMAIRTAGGGNLCGTTHHSDRGSQYACYLYVDILMEHHIRISMTETYNPTDNAIAERQNGILKIEKIYLQEMYQSYEQARKEIEKAIDFYNRIRPHMSIGMKRPMEVYMGERPGKNLWKKK